MIIEIPLGITSIDEWVESAIRNWCYDCESDETILENYDMMWHDGDLHCAHCGKYIRMFDAG